MAKEKKSQEKTKELTYKDCVWYMADIDRCKLPGSNERFMKCIAQKKGKMDDFCVWVTNFIESEFDSTKNKSKEVQLELFNTDDQFDFENSFDLAPENYMDKLFEKASKTLKKWRNEKKVKEE